MLPSKLKVLAKFGLCSWGRNARASRPQEFVQQSFFFYDNCRNSRALGQFLLSICRQTHEFEIHPSRQRASAGNSTICYRKKQIDVSF